MSATSAFGRFIERPSAWILFLLWTSVIPGCRSSIVKVEPNPECSLFGEGERLDRYVVASTRGHLDPLLQGVNHTALITVDCEGEPGPGLATSWSRFDNGRRWGFRLDGAGETAPAVRDLVREWRERLSPSWQIDSIRVDNDHAISIYFTESFDEPPHFLASPEFSASNRSAGRIEDLAARDGRDVLAAGDVDILISSDPSVIEYASGQEKWQVAGLPWDRVYVLATPGAAGSRETRRLEFPEGFAADAVREEARAVRSIGWWQDLGECETHRIDTPRMVPERAEIVYGNQDPVARDLAARIVALASNSDGKELWARWFSGRSPTARRANSADFARTLAKGESMSYVFYLDRRPYDACGAERELIEKAPWLARRAGQIALDVAPLVETRPHIIARSRVQVSVDWFGRIIF